MLTKRVKFLGLLVLIIGLAIMMTGCDMGNGVVDETLEITGVEEISDKNVGYGTDFENINLPEKIVVTLEDNSTTTLDVNWLEGDYDGEAAGTYTIVGELELTDDIINPDDLYSTVQVTVDDELYPPLVLGPGLFESPGPFINTVKPIFEWYHETEEKVESYVLTISEEPYGTENIVYQAHEVYGEYYTLEEELEPDKKYSWNMQARSSDGKLSAVSDTLYFQIVEEDMLGKYIVTIEKNGEGTVEPPADTYIMGEEIELEAFPAEGWKFHSWSISDAKSLWSVHDNPAVVDLWDVYSEIKIVAHFEENDE